MNNPNPYPTMLFLTGPQPFDNSLFCATCAMLYHGVASTEPALRMKAQEIMIAAEKRNAEHATHNQEVREVGPCVYEFPSGRLVALYPAITIGPSVHFPHASMPVCWMHLQGFDPTKPAENGKPPSALVKGKKFDTGKEAA